MRIKGMSKIAVVLFNLGGPDSKNAVRPFLMNFFMDPNIIRVPIPFRCLIANKIAKKRSQKEAKDSYDALGGSSPLLENSKYQAQSLHNILNLKQDGNEYKVFICMRYWHPMAPQVVREVRDWQAEQIILLPLYPQYSTTTTKSSLQAWQKACHEADYTCPTRMICCYPWNEGYVQASAMNVLNVYEQAQAESGHKPRVLFSAHGLPESVIKQGDPYRWQCEQSAEKIAKATGIEDMDWQICFQSRVGPQKWIGPSTEEALKAAAKDNVPVIIYPHAFTQEHVETLVEIEEEYRELAEEMGLHHFYRVPTVGIAEQFIEGLANMVYGQDGNPEIKPDTGHCLCPEKYNQCCMREFSTTSW